MKRRRELQHFYHVLGLRVGATEAEIREAYKVLAKKYHPDRNQGDSQAMERFLEIQKARDALIGRKTESRAITKAEEIALEKALEIKRSEKAKTGGKALVAVIVLVVTMAVGGFAVWALSLGRLEVQANSAMLAERHDQAIEKLEAAIIAAEKKKTPDKKHQLVRALACVHARAGRWDKAREILSAQSLDAKDSMTESLLGDVLFRLGQTKKASLAHDRAVQIAGADSEEAARRAAFLLRADQIKAANSELSRLATLSTPEGEWAKALLAVRSGDGEAAVEVISKKGSFVDTANLGAATLLVGSKSPEDRRKAKFRESEGFYTAAHGQSGVAAIAGKHFGVFVAVPQSGSDKPQFVPLLGAEHQRAGVVAGLAESRLAQARYGYAISAFQNAVELEKDLAPLHTRLAEAYLLKAATEQSNNAALKAAEFRVRMALEADPNYAPAHMTMADVRLGMGDRNGALAAAQEGLKMQPNNPRLYADMARIYGSFGETGREIQYYQRALRLDPGFGEARMALGESLLLSGRYRQGVAELERAARDPKFTEDAWEIIDYEAFDRDDYRGSIRALKKRIELDPDNHQLYYRMARCYGYLRDDRSAWNALRLAHEKGFTDMSLLKAEPAFERLRRRYGDLGSKLLNEAS